MNGKYFVAGHVILAHFSSVQFQYQCMHYLKQYCRKRDNVHWASNVVKPQFTNVSPPNDRVNLAPSSTPDSHCRTMIVKCYHAWPHHALDSQ